MKYLILGATFLSATVFGLTLKASTVEAYGKKYNNNCAYFTSIIGELVLVYNNPDLNTTGIKVFVHHGLDGFSASTNNNLEWQDIKDSEMELMGNSLWKINLRFTLNSRGDSKYYEGLSFVFMVVKPDGTVSYDNSGGGLMSYYQIRWPDAGIGCGSMSGSSTIPMNQLMIGMVKK